MKRRRRKPQGGRQPEPHQGVPPLQPMYPEFSGPGDVPERPAPPAPPEPTQAADRAEFPEPAPVEGGQPRSRRRRKRGGRGRKRGGAPTTPAPAAQPEAAVEPAEQPAAEPELLPEDVPEPAPTVVAAAEPVSAPAGPAKPARRPKGVVVLAIGLPGSGKSSWFKRRGVSPLSSDLLRTLLFDNITEQRYQDLVFSTLRSLLRARLIARMPWNYVDATNLSPKERRGWIKMAQEFGYEVQAVFFDVPLEVCQERNLRRQRVVPEDVMARMAAKLRPPTFEEGFSKITVVRVKPREEPA